MGRAAERSPRWYYDTPSTMHRLGIVVVMVSAATFAYVVAIYPVLLGYVARRHRPVHKEWLPLTVSVIIPVHNGARYLKAKLNSVLQLDYPKRLLEVVVVSDGSTDKTDEITEEFASAGVRLLRVPRGGKSAALSAAIPLTRGKILLLTDVRQQINPNSLKLLVSCFAEPTVGAVSGHLIIRPGDDREQADIGLYWRYETWIRDNLALVDSMFGATGPLYAIRRELTVPIPPEVLLDDMYLPLAAFRDGYRLIVEPAGIAIDIPTGRQVEFKRKVRTLAGNYQLLCYHPWLLGPSNRMWIHFVSYKIGRLILPYALVGFLIGSLGLPSGWREASFFGQVGFYTLAGIDGLIPDASSLKRISSPACTFVTMMIAAVYGLSVFFVPPQSLWKVTDVPEQD